VPATLLGYGEISAIFQIGPDPGTAYKRMPLFSDRGSAERYASQYHEYCGLLAEAGLCLPESCTHIVEVPGHPVVLYIAQRRLPPDRVAHRLLHSLDLERVREMAERIVKEIEKVWAFNRARGPALELAIDGQISNWVPVDEDGTLRLYYLDTSTPLYRKDGAEQLDPKLLLQSAPGFLRWMLEWIFLDDVMNRYYDPRKVYTDLAANLYKEQRPDLIPDTVEIINRGREGTNAPLTEKEIRRYYTEDRIIWSAFLNLRKLDRWISTRLRGKRYEFILPGKIKR
jgi:hypothetical protein